IADRLGLNVTDHKCADLLERLGPMTAGELAQRTGLTTGAITGVIDRLEKAGFARPTQGPHDPRRGGVAPDAQRSGRKIGPLFESIARASAELCARYSTRDLALIRDFTARASQLTYEETAKLREGAARGRQPRRRTARRQDKGSVPQA